MSMEITNTIAEKKRDKKFWKIYEDFLNRLHKDTPIFDKFIVVIIVATFVLCCSAAYIIIYCSIKYYEDFILIDRD